MVPAGNAAAVKLRPGRGGHPDKTGENFEVIAVSEVASRHASGDECIWRFAIQDYPRL